MKNPLLNTKEIPVELTITRRVGDSEVVCVQVECPSSRNNFLTLEVPIADFTRALMGLSGVKSRATVRGLSVVGKHKVIENRIIECPLPPYTATPQLEKWLLENAQEDGWFVATYLGSRSSVVTVNGKTMLHYRVFKYVKEPT
jgi:hypothetical protein